MILIYIDESGDTGTNLNDPQQPIFVLGAVLIEQTQWKILELEYNSIINEAFNNTVPPNFEIHAMDLVNRKNQFSVLSLDDSKLLRNKLLDLIQRHKIPVYYRKIEKKRYQKYCEDRYGKGIKIDPYIMAFPFIGLQVDNYLKEKKDLGIFIFDEHRSIIDIEQSLKSLRLTDDTVMHLDAVIEKGFFVDSTKSFALQLVDLLLYYIRKYEEFKIGKKVSTIHQEVFEQITTIAVNLDKHPKGLQILDWVDGQVKK